MDGYIVQVTSVEVKGKRGKPSCLTAKGRVVQRRLLKVTDESLDGFHGTKDETDEHEV